MYAARKIEKRPVSVRMRQRTATFRLDGKLHSVVSAGSKKASFIIESILPGTRFLVLPVGILRMLQIPKRTTTADNRNILKVVNRRRRSRGPFERPCIPRIVAGQLALLHRANDVDDKKK